MKSYTDIEQSKKLTEILPLESADMYYQYALPKSDKIMYNPILGNPIDALEWYNKGYTNFGKNPLTLNEFCIPCWSLAALLDILSKSEDKAFDVSYGHTFIPKWYISYVDNSKNMSFVKTIDGDNLIDIVVQLLIYIKANEQI